MRLFIVLLIFFTTSLQLCAQGLSSFEYKKADSIAGLYPRHSLTNLAVLSRKLTGNLLTDEGKFRAIYKWVCLNIDNDYKLAVTNKRQRARLTGNKLAAWNADLIPIVNKKLINEYSTICTGYAWLIEQLSMHAGFECKMVHGYGRTAQANIGGKGIANHSWNAIKLNGTWYLCDATWSSGGISMETRSFVRKYEDAYFLPDPEFFIRNHYPLEKNWTLLDNPPTLHEFLNAPK